MASDRPGDNFSSADALELILRKVRESSELLALEIRQVIDAGTVDVATDQPRSGRKRPRSFQKSRPYSDEEALEIAIRVLRTYFIVLPSCIRSAHAEFNSVEKSARAAVEIWFDERRQENVAKETTIGIEQVPETARIQPKEDVLFPLHPPTDEELKEQADVWRRIADLLDIQ